MADNTRLNPGSSGDLISTDDLGGSPAVKVQRVKVQHGADGVATDASADSPLPTSAEPFLPETPATDALWKVYSGTVSGGEVEFDFNDDLGRDARSVSIEIGAADATVAVKTAAGSYGDEFPLDASASAPQLAVEGLSIDTMRLKDATNTTTYTILAF